mgnify:CR=1 FL=1
MEEKRKSKIIYIVLLLCLLGVAAGLTYAWFRQSYSLSTVAKIKASIRLDLAAGNGEDASRFQIGTVDTTGDGVTHKDYVIAVKKDKQANYILQIGHTTNIPFTYTLYKAGSGTENDNNVVYVGEKETFYYKKGTVVSGKYLNKKSEDIILANSTGTYHEQTYESYSNIQENAEPLYWHSTDALGSGTDSVDYYILTVSWKKRGSEQTKSDDDKYQYIDDIEDKETDIVYISVSAKGGGN